MYLRPLLLLALASAAQTQSVTFEKIQQIGGSAGQTVAGMATDPQGNVYIAGSTSSVDYPTKSALQQHPGGSGLYLINGPGPQFRNLYQSGLASVSVLAADPRTPSTMYAVSDRGLSRSTDGGATWSALTGVNAPITAVVVDPTSSSTLYVSTSTQGVLKSTDGGVTWNAINNGIGPDFENVLNVYHLWIDPRQPTVLFASTYPGLARSTDGGATWQTNTQFTPYTEVLDMAFDPNTPGATYAATLGNLQKSTDDGLTWNVLPLPSSSFGPRAFLFDPKHPGTLYVGGLYTGIFSSTDGGNTWTSLSPRSSPTVQINVIALAADPATGSLYALEQGSLVVSNDGFVTTTPAGPTGIISAVVAYGGRVLAGAQAGSDVYVAKYDPQGNVLYATYYGGSGTDLATGMAVDSTGAVYVTGRTTSPDLTVSPKAFAGSGSNFVLKVNPDGSFGYATYFGAAGTLSLAIAADSAGHAYITGYTQGNLPVTSGAIQPTLKGSNPCCNILGPGPPPVSNAFLTEFDATGASLVASTYIGNQTAYANALVLLPNGDAILSGGYSLYHVKGDGTALLNTGSLPGVIWSLTTDSAGNIYADGQAMTSTPQFPTTPGVFQTQVDYVSGLPGTLGNTGDGDGFVTKMDAQFNVLASTLIGGEAPDETVAVAVAPNGNILLGGSTYSKAFPSRGAVQGSFSTTTGFVAELTPDLSSILFSTYTGDSRQFVVTAVAPTPDGGFVFAGATQLAPFNGPTFFGGPSVPSPTPGIQGYLVKGGLQPSAPRIDRAVNAASQLGVPLSPGAVFQVQGDGFGSDAVLEVNGTPLPLIAQSRTALTAMLPSDFNASSAVTISVQSAGSSSSPYLAPIAATAPGIYSVDGTGAGQGYILNSDGTLNSPDNPADEGSAITIYATGVGPISFVGDYAVTAFPVNVDIDGFYANGIAAKLGKVPGLPGDVYQISVYVPRPADFAAGNPNLKNFVMPPTVAVSMEVNGARSQAGLALSVAH
ncbi:MAG TPA: SBBP repeat-containing protein [Bryobacteraceae bacterium]|nr:SBBP repeat-containing protein [Bryobacteraceae bacterium]